MWTKFYNLLLFSTVVFACKKSQPSKPPPEPRCNFPKLGKEASKIGADILCSGFGERFLNKPKTYNDIAPALRREGGVIEDGDMVIKKHLIVPKTNPKSTTCFLRCPLGFVPEVYVTRCNGGQWTWDPKSISCVPSSCGSPPPPPHGRFWCYKNPATCYLICDPGYVNMDENPFVTCRGSSWNKEPSKLVCEEAVALITGGYGRPTYNYRAKGKIWPETCQTAEVFSLKDQRCSEDFLNVLKIGVTGHTTHLLNGKILLCGGRECGRISERSNSDRPIYEATSQYESCFKLEDDNSWAFHSKWKGRKQSHVGGLQLNQLQLSGGLEANLRATIKLHNNSWIKGRTPALPAVLYAYDSYTPCMVVTSPHTFIVIGAPETLLRKTNVSSVVEFNSLTREWRALPDMPVLRSGHACTLVNTKTGPGIMVAGGSYRAEPQKTVHLLDLGTEQWFPAGSLHVEREEFALAVLGEQLVALGSYYFFADTHSDEEETVEEYVVPCPSMSECHPSQEGTWTQTDRIIGRRKSLSVLPVASSRFNCNT